ncbi:hypothetical protein GQ55_9G064000 [Panicum hallii var. hallii]|uniref:SWIM-type domain-containing protein n=1 Tax=Panicum hallii var. hallii TaxID=1504633 RepID=A0A2T7C0L1_9POAL|nr:hypothetical protein GQ55_9G064000 [Panicum hallii var. hallii]
MVDRAAAPADAASCDPPPETDAPPRQAGAADEQEDAPAGAAAGPPPPPQQAGDADEGEDISGSPAGPPGERCGAMMEVVGKDGGGGKWKVSKLVVEHNHELQVAPGEVAATVPALGMEFESADAAKEFYYGYGERVGFKARTGSNRRSVGDGEKIMQRFQCWRGIYSSRRGKGKDSDEGKEAEEMVEDAAAAAAAGKRKREPYKTRSRNAAKKDAEVVEVEKGVGVGGAENGLEVQNGRGSRRGRSKKGMVEQDGKSVAGLEAEKDGVQVAAAASNDKEEEEDEGKDQEGVEEEVQVEVKRGRGRPRKAVTEDDTLQAHVLRELGVRASQYNHEERKKILSKYLSKRQSRPTSSRPTKIASRQALAERRKRGNGGRFLSSEGQLPSERRSKRLEKQNLKMEEKAEGKEDDIIEAEPDPEDEVGAGPGGEPKIGMVFLNEDKAYEFYVNYAGAEGFSVRKGFLDKTAKNVTKSRAYVCSKEGFRPKNIYSESKKPRPETRTGCQAHMTIKITSSGKYVVTEFVSDHNHDREAPLVDIQILKSQKLLSKVQQPPDPPKVVLIPNEYKNYTRTKRIKNMQLGDAQAISEYLRRMKGENPSFFYAVQVDEDDQFTNVFWADIKSIMDYNYFGDVVCIDTRYCTSDYGRPLLLFIGVNHHKQPIIFGTALIYDDSVQSFRWLFETFKSAMSGKQPKTVLTDQSTALIDAISSVWPGTTHRFSLLHLYLTASNVLRDNFQDSETFTLDFSRWLYDYEEEDFISSWEILSEKYNLKDNEWLSKLYDGRERWALPYGRDTFCADIAATLRSDNTDTILKDLLKPEVDLRTFFNSYDKFLEEKRLAEQQADYLGAQMTQRVAPLRLLWQAANSYTPTLFEMFRMEFEQISNCIVYGCGEIGPISEYQVTVKDRPRGQFVRFDSTQCMAVCSCKKFEFTGLPCCHVLKILELRNIKELPPHYILKRWRKDAQSEAPGESYSYAAIDEDPRFSLSRRYNTLCRTLYKIAAKASESIEAYAFLENQYEQLVEQVEVLLQAKLHDKSSLSAILKGHQPHLHQSEVSNSEPRRVTAKKNKNVEPRRRQQSPLDSNKKKKARQGLLEPEEIDIPLRVVPPTVSNDIPNHLRTPTSQFLAPSHIMQAPYVAQQFGLGSLQGFPAMPPFAQLQEPTPLQQPSHLQPPPYHNVPQIPQAPPPDIQSLQFLSSNPQLGHQTTDQGQYTIPVWDFL